MRMVFVVLALIPSMSMAVELGLLRGEGSVGFPDLHSSVVEHPEDSGIWGIDVSAGKEAGVRYGASFSFAQYGSSSYQQYRLGLGLSYRFPVFEGLFVEPLLDVAYLKYGSANDGAGVHWNSGDGIGMSVGSRVGYQVGRLVMGLSVQQQFSRSTIRFAMQDAACMANCNGPNPIYNPYAGLGIVRDRASEKALKESGLLALFFSFRLP